MCRSSLGGGAGGGTGVLYRMEEAGDTKEAVGDNKPGEEEEGEGWKDEPEAIKV